MRGRDIKKYSYNFADLWLIFIPWHFPLHNDKSISGSSTKAEEEFKIQYPAIYNHLLIYKDKLSARNKSETGIRYEWYALQRCANTYWEDFSKPKIVYSEIVKEPQFHLDNNQYYPEATTFIMTGKSIKYIVAFLNSKFVTYFFKKFYAGGGLGEIGYRYKKKFLELIPIPEISMEEQLPILEKVELITKLKEENPDANTSKLVDEIDRMVFNLYGLSEEEIQFFKDSK